MRAQVATRTDVPARLRRRFKLSPDEQAELGQHPFARIPGTARDEYGDTVLDVKPTPDRSEAWDQGALLGLHMLDAAAECRSSGRAKAVPRELVALLCRDADDVHPGQAAAWRLNGFMRVLEMVIDGYLSHRHHGHDAPHVIGLEQAWMQWSGRAVS